MCKRVIALQVLSVVLATGSVWAQKPSTAHPARGTVEVAFTPWDDAEGLLVRTLAGAKRSIHVQAYLLTSATVAQALVDAHRRGVRVQVLADRQPVDNSDLSKIPQLAQAGIAVALESRYAIAHNKVVLVDADGEDCAIITGSYNFTQSAQSRNAENLLVLRGDTALAAAYLANWQRHRDEAQTYTAGGSTAAPVKIKPPKASLRFPWESTRSGPEWLRF